MSKLRKMCASFDNSSLLDPRLEFEAVSIHILLRQVTCLAESYPYPHNLLGRNTSRHYIERLALDKDQKGQGWFVLHKRGIVYVAIHSKKYGLNHPSGHNLWKLRHPLLSPKATTPQLSRLFVEVVNLVAQFWGGSHKFVLFLSERELEAIAAATAAGFTKEGKLADYYRFMENCLIFGISLPAQSLDQ